MTAYRIDGDLLHIGTGFIQLRDLVNFLGDAGVLSRYEWLQCDSLEFDDAVQDEVDQALVTLATNADEFETRLDSAIDELSYYGDTDPYRHHDDNLHTGSVKFCIDPFCQTAGQTDTVIDILRGA